MEKKYSYFSTNHRSQRVTFREALMSGLAPDRGLYMPAELPVISHEELEGFSEKSYGDIAFAILEKILINEIDKDDLFYLCRDAYNFEVPVEQAEKHKYILRLDQGPTASFKDFAARIMSRLMQHYLSKSRQHLTILTATSGDTGSAVASAFYGMKNISVIILFPSGEVTEMQRKQMTTLKDNIKVIAIDGKFDDCQRLVKMAFVDQSFKGIALSSANSINIGRLLPQSVYYFYAWSRVSGTADEKVVLSVPCGNFGNLAGGLLAGKMGLPCGKFIISTNENDEVPRYLRTGKYKSVNPSKNCISSAMNVGHPSNLARIISLYGGNMNESGKMSREPDLNKMRDDLFPVSVSDSETRKTIQEAYRNQNILLEPHGAVAWYGLKEYYRNYKMIEPDAELSISLETAHPAKFPDEIREILKIDPPLPPSLKGISEREELYFKLENNYELLKQFILKNH